MQANTTQREGRIINDTINLKKSKGKSPPNSETGFTRNRDKHKMLKALGSGFF